MNPPSPPRKQSFAPVVDADTSILILGSLPGEISLAHGQYYANRHNRFWALVGAVIGENLEEMDYAPRLQTLLRHHIGLWDVVAEARRAGSLDSQIRDVESNDLAGLILRLPELEVIAFNGKTAARIGLRQLGPLANHHRIVQLPSSSPAHTQPFVEKLAAWRALTG